MGESRRARIATNRPADSPERSRHLDPTTHPPADTLLRFLDGRLPRRYAAEVERHVSECGVCLTLLERAAFTSPLLATIQKAMRPTGGSEAPPDPDADQK